MPEIALERGKAVAAGLRDRGVSGILITAAERGYVTDLACAIPECLCPEELGGRTYFEMKTLDLSDWMPTPDHFPILKKDGGHLTVTNVRLAHRLCNRVDYSKQIGRTYARDLARVEAARRTAIERRDGARATLKVAVWNMSLREGQKNWAFFKDHGELASDIALLNEARRPSPSLGIQVQTAGTTVGRDDRTLGGNKRRDWATAVASPHPIEPPADVWALPPARKDRRSKMTASRPGSWTAAIVHHPNGEAITAISLYGLLDERSDASVHRSLSDVTPLLEDKRYNRLLLLGGDLNTLCTAKAGSAALARDQGVLDRITKGFGLIDVLRQTLERRTPPRGRLEGCKCSLGDECMHTWTYRRSPTSKIAYQDDFLFASPALAKRLLKAEARPFTRDWPSDHAPIIATFR